MNKLFKLLKEPILLFFLIGILIFIFYEMATGYIDLSGKRIEVSTAQIELLAETFTKTWNRPPNENELLAQIESHVKDEIYFKEAVAMGLDKSDLAIKRRLRQIMELMMDDMATVYPSENQLQKYLAENPDKFREDPRISFKQIYYAAGNKQDAIDLLKKIKNGKHVDESNMGSLAMVPNTFEDESYRQVERVFGNPFTKSVFELEPEEWHGPVESAYGWHLVFNDQLTEGFIPELKVIWDEVEREWTLERKTEMMDRIYQKMKEKYSVKIETFQEDGEE